MRKLFVLALSFSSLVFADSIPEKVEIEIITKILVKNNETEDLMVLIHEDAKELTKKYIKEKGVKSIETEVQNKTLLEKEMQ